MAQRTAVADILDPLLEQLTAMLQGKGEHHPLALVHERLDRLVHELRHDPPTIDKFKTLGELGFLKEHSLQQDMTEFHDAIQRAVDEAMTPGWS
jgi:hypothetical protein